MTALEAICPMHRLHSTELVGLTKKKARVFRCIGDAATNRGNGWHMPHYFTLSDDAKAALTKSAKGGK